MKRILILLIFSVLMGCPSSNSADVDPECKIHNGKQLYKGPKGGCYYKNSNGNKTYVDRQECRC